MREHIVKARLLRIITEFKPGFPEFCLHKDGVLSYHGSETSVCTRITWMTGEDLEALIQKVWGQGTWGCLASFQRILVLLVLGQHFESRHTVL